LTSEEMHPDIQVQPNLPKQITKLEYLELMWFGWVMVLTMTRTDTSTIYAVSSTKTIVTIIETNTEDNNYLPLHRT
jgi:hypothetical protein